MRRSVDRGFSTTIVALDVGGTKIAGALVECGQADTPPRVSERRSMPTDAARGGAAVLESVCGLARELVSAASGSVAGIGVGAAGVVDPTTGAVRYANDLMPGWSGQPLESRLSDDLGLPVAVLGDVHAHALGEARWGCARGTQSCLCVGIGTGLGGAFVLDGKVVRGFRGAAGHIGHTIHPAAAGISCACGKESHVESVTAGSMLGPLYAKRMQDSSGGQEVTGLEVARRAEQGDLEALSVLEHAGFALGEAIGSWCNLLDPELVVLSGSVTRAGAFWRRALDEGFKAQVMEPLCDTPILYAALGDDSALVGAAEYALDTL